MSLSNLYDRLEPKERLRLALAARARGDSEETRRLVESCPMKPYKIHDPVFMDPWHRCLDLALLFEHLWSFHHWRFAFLDLVVALFKDPQGTKEMLSKVIGGGSRRKAARQGAEKVPATVEEEWVEALCDLISLHRVFARFCREVVEVEPKHLMRAAVTEAELIRLLLEREDLPPDEEREAEWFGLLSRFWRPGAPAPT